MPKEYRSRTRIVLDLLRAVHREPGLGTTRLLFLANLSHERLQEYLGEVKTRGFVEETTASDKKSYKLTEVGQKFLTELERIHNFMADFGLGL